MFVTMERPSHLSPEPARDGLLRRLGGAGVDLGLGDRAEGVVDHDGREVGHTEGGALHLGLVRELGGNDDRGRAAQGFEGDAVMRTARRARPSIADRGQDDVVLGGDPRDQRRVG